MMQTRHDNTRVPLCCAGLGAALMTGLLLAPAPGFAADAHPPPSAVQRSLSASPTPDAHTVVGPAQPPVWGLAPSAKNGTKGGPNKGKKKKGKQHKNSAKQNDVVIFAGPQFMFNAIKEVRATDDPEEESEGSLFSEPTPSEAEDPFTKWGVGLGASVSVYLPAILGTNGLVAPGVTYTFSKPTYQGRDRTVFVDDSASLASNTTTDSAVYTAKQHTLTAGIGLGLNQAKKGTFQLIAPVQVGASWGDVEATVASKPGTPLQSRYVGGAFTFGVSGIVRMGKHAYLLVNIIEAHLAFGDLKGDGMPFRESDRFNASYLPLSLQLGVGF